MSKEKILDEDLCWNCNKHEISCLDYREDDCGSFGKVASCQYCINLNSVNHYRVRKEGLDPKKLLDE